MPEIIIIVAQTENRVIGKEGKMPWHLPRDLRHFKENTLGYPIIMGHKTYLSMGKALPGRSNYVISRNPDLSLPDASVYPTPESALLACEQAEKVFLIGGAMLYSSMLDKAHTLIVTWIHTTLDGDTYFPEINPALWQETTRNLVRKDDKNIYDMSFVCYIRK